MRTRRHLLLLSMILAGDSSFMKALNQPSCIKPGSKPFVEQIWATSVGPLFNFAHYAFDNNVDCCNTAPLCCEFPPAQGYLVGLHFEFTHSRPSKWYANVQFDGEWNAGYVNNTANTFLQIKDYRPEIDFGYNFFIHKNHYYITPFTGLGFYYLSTEIKNDVLTNKYNNLYVPIGFDLTWNVHPDCFENVVECFTAGLTAEYRIDAWTRLKMTTNEGTTCTDGTCPDLCCDTSCEPCAPATCNPEKIKLNSRTQGVHVELVFNWFPTFNEKVNFIATGAPFFDWNRFGSACITSCESDAGVPVPKLTRWYLGFHAQMGIRF